MGEKDVGESEPTSDAVMVDLILTMPEGYPDSGVVTVEGSVVNNGGSEESKGWVKEHLPQLVGACQAKADACEGRQCLLNILESADAWIQNEWNEKLQVIDEEVAEA